MPQPPDAVAGRRPQDAMLVGEDDTPKEACGVFGVYAPDSPVSHLTYLGLYALQHRGQESAGIAVSDGSGVTVVKDMGLVSTVFDDRVLAALPGRHAIGHTRYSTTGSSTWRNSQPVFRGTGHHEFALGHNGNLVNTVELAEQLGMLPGTITSDSDLIAELIVRALPQGNDESGLVGAIARVLPQLRGAFSLVLLDTKHVIGVRDP
ncbi:MAG TPA: class II glutamine amidotransferase, partial [Acidimicrobiales bacterium]